MGIIKRLFKEKVSDTSDKQRLKVVPEVRALREKFDDKHFSAVLKAREEWFQNTPQIRKVDKR